MGFKLFDQSGTFNPFDYGLSPGDVIHAVVVGGGGGGCYNTNTKAYGGNGASSSFGNFVTALGGYGATYNKTLPWRGTPTQYMTKGSYQGESGDYRIGGTGGGGWYPGLHRHDATSFIWYQTSLTGSQYYTITPEITIEADRHTGGAPGRIYKNNSTNYFCYLPKVITNDYWSARIISYSTSQVTAQFVPCTPVAGGGGDNNWYSYTGIPYGPGRSYNEGNGGLGYGAGGGSVSPVNYTAGGCGGELREGDYRLTSVDAITITVGGGGSGGGYYNNNSKAYAGNDGSAGAAGAAFNQYGCPGGYGTMIPTPNSIFNNNNYTYYVAGGGAGGCVALWW